MKRYVLLLSCLFSSYLWSAEVVKVGIYDFPPYVFMSDKPSGIALALITEMNKLQDQYRFEAVATTSRRRYHDFTEKKFDVLLFEDKKWGWQQYPISASQPYFTDAEVYVTQSKAGRGQEFFDDLTSKVIVGVLGYHYKFANFNSDLDYLTSHFNFIHTENQKSSLELMLNQRGDIAILAKSYIDYHLSKKPEDNGKLLISEKTDQIYRHTILVRDNHSLSVHYLNDLLKKMKQQKVLNKLWQGYGLKEYAIKRTSRS